MNSKATYTKLSGEWCKVNPSQFSLKGEKVKLAGQNGYYTTVRDFYGPCQAFVVTTGAMKGTWVKIS